MSTPPVLGNANNNCIQYKPECVDEQQKQLFYSGIVFTAVGMAALSACYAPFAQEQVEESRSTRRSVGSCRTHFVAFSALLIAAFVKSWAILFGICAALSVVSFFACVILWVISGFNNAVPRPQGSPLTTIFRVIFAASSKCFCPLPQDMSELYDKPDPLQEEHFPHTMGLRCLDKAAIIKVEPPLEQQERKRWNLCKVTEVEETKIFIRSIPLWMTSIVCGIVSSLGATYFLEQAKHLDPRVRKLRVPLILFFWFYDHCRKSFTTWLFPIFSKSHRCIPRFGIAVAMMSAILSCIAAAKVETRRLRVVKSHGLIDRPDDKVPMTIFWLLPQFAFLGFLDGIYRLSVYGFSLDQAPKSMIKYFNLSARAFFGFGVIGSVVFVDIVGKICERKGTNWFQRTLNRSHLDNYYWLLAASAAINLLIFIVVALFYRYRKTGVTRLVAEGLLPAGFMDDDHI